MFLSIQDSEGKDALVSVTQQPLNSFKVANIFPKTSCPSQEPLATCDCRALKRWLQNQDIAAAAEELDVSKFLGFHLKAHLACSYSVGLHRTNSQWAGAKQTGLKQRPGSVANMGLHPRLSAS